MTTPYVPYAPFQGGLTAMFVNVVQVIRETNNIQPDGTLAISWQPLAKILDPVLNLSGLMRCRIDLGFIRRGVDQPAPIVAGKAPDRVGVVFYMPTFDPITGVPDVQAGDRLVCVPSPITGRLPITGTFEVRQIPDVALDFIGSHHVETQVVEVSQALQPGSVTPFPGGST